MMVVFVLDRWLLVEKCEMQSCQLLFLCFFFLVGQLWMQVLSILFLKFCVFNIVLVMLQKDMMFSMVWVFIIGIQCVCFFSMMWCILLRLVFGVMVMGVLFMCLCMVELFSLLLFLCSVSSILWKVSMLIRLLYFIMISELMFFLVMVVIVF